MTGILTQAHTVTGLPLNYPGQQMDDEYNWPLLAYIFTGVADVSDIPSDAVIPKHRVALL